MDAIRKSIEKLYVGVCTIYTQEKTVDPATKQTVFTPVALVTDQPCRVSYSERTNPAGKEGPVASVAQSIKLFIAPEIEVPEGCKITVTQHGRTVDYRRSGPAAVYSRHQEIGLELFKGWA